MTPRTRPVALVTGVGRAVGIGAGIALRLAADGWDVASNYWDPYDERMPWGRRATDVESMRDAGPDTIAVLADLERTDAPEGLFDAVEAGLGPVTALVLAHCESADSGLMHTSVESFDRHFAVNARASWLPITEFATRYRGQPGAGRIVALTSDHTVGNLPYGASKAALDRIVIASARELAPLRITANVINPGQVDQTPAGLGALVARAVLAVDPDAAARRRAEAVRDREVRFTPGTDGMASLWARLPAEDALGCYGNCASWPTSLYRPTTTGNRSTAPTPAAPTPAARTP